MLISPFSIMKSHVFQSANEHKGMKVRSAPGDMVANQHHIWVTKIIATWRKNKVRHVISDHFISKIGHRKRLRLD